MSHIYLDSPGIALCPVQLHGVPEWIGTHTAGLCSSCKVLSFCIQAESNSALGPDDVPLSLQETHCKDIFEKWPR